MRNPVTEWDREVCRKDWKKLYRMMRRTHSVKNYLNLYDRLEKRSKLAAALKEYAVRGVVYVQVSGHDCDHSTYDYIRKVPATPMHYDRFEADRYECREGPEYHNWLTAQEAQEYEPAPSRDLTLEAFENGHPHLIRY